jgi:hypothetical protein
VGGMMQAILEMIGGFVAFLFFWAFFFVLLSF